MRQYLHVTLQVGRKDQMGFIQGIAQCALKYEIEHHVSSSADAGCVYVTRREPMLKFKVRYWSAQEEAKWQSENFNIYTANTDRTLLTQTTIAMKMFSEALDQNIWYVPELEFSIAVEGASEMVQEYINDVGIVISNHSELAKYWGIPQLQTAEALREWERCGHPSVPDKRILLNYHHT